MRVKGLGRIVTLACLWVGICHAQVASPQVSYAIVSLVGDKITVVTLQAAVGSNLDKNIREEVPMPDDTFDGAAVFAAGDAIKRLQPGVATKLYSIREPKLFALQDKLLDSPNAATALAEPLKPLLAESKVTHLVLITKHRADTSVRLLDEQVGSGKLSGVGFYVDPVTVLVDRASGNRSVGFFSPYAYLTVTVLDAASLRPLRQASTTSSTLVLAANSTPAAIAWDVLTPAQKVQALKGIIREAIDEAMPRVLEPR